jgi:glucose/arabinose dehydrogenase
MVTKYAQHLDFLPEMVRLLKPENGWKVEIAASGLGKPRTMHATDDGRLYVTRRDAGDVLMLTDKDGDKKFDDLTTVLYEFKGVHGIAVKDSYMYLCNNKQLRRYPMKGDGTLGAMELLISDLPNAGQHANRTIAFGPDGMLYISVGTLCNDCKESDPEAATMLQVDPKTWKRSIFASGLRNTIGFDFHPHTKHMWGMDNGGDGKGNRWPPEELNRIEKGGNYGYPFAYGKREIDQSREDPAGDMKDSLVVTTMPSQMEFTAHMAPIDFKFIGSDALVTWHGSWNRSKPVGFKVQRITFDQGRPTGATDFLTGFLKPGFPLLKRKARFGRPAGLAITPDQSVYVSDDANGVIYLLTKTP